MTAEAERWWLGLSAKDAERAGRVINMLEEGGPALGRQRVKLIKGSRHHNMKELRPNGGHIRMLFAFDKERRAAILVGGDKTNDWVRWYDRNIPLADRLYDRHLRNAGKETTWRAVRSAGERSAASGR